MGDLFALHQVDARKLGEIVPDESVDVTITSPPYFNLKDYGFDEQIGYGQDYQVEYLRDLRGILGALYKATKTTGSLWLIADAFKRGGRLVALPFHLAQRAELEGWRLTDIMIWNKTKTLPWSGKGQLRSVFEYILFFTKSSEYKFYVNRIREPTELKQWWVKYPERYNPQGKVPSDIWTFKIPTQGSWGSGFLRHFCPFPSGLVERIVTLTTDVGDVVMDPFAGSGVVLAQAHWMKRRYVGFELKDEYCKMFEKNVLPEIGKEWRARERERGRTEKARRHLEETIKKLRQLKFAYAIVKQVATEAGCSVQELAINTEFAISNRANGQWPRNGSRHLKETIILVVDRNEQDAGKLSEIAARVVERSPEWKYEVEAEIQVMGRRDALRLRTTGQLFQNEHLWVYSASQFNWYKSEITFSQWSEESKNASWRSKFSSNSYPLVSNIRMRQAVEEFRVSEGHQEKIDALTHDPIGKGSTS